LSKVQREQQDWITRTVDKLQIQNQKKLQAKHCKLPSHIVLTALQQSFSICYICRNNQDLVIETIDKTKLIISGDTRDKKSIFNLLEYFFKNYAREYLKQRLDQLSSEFNLPYNRLTVRAQKTRWGSCSSKKNINLNYRLIFMDKQSMDYILLHELLHTIHMNHSKVYWSHFERLMPDALYRDKQINQMAKKLPCWMFDST